MLALITRRLLLSVPLVFVVTGLSFALESLVPGDAATGILGANATPASLAQLRKRIGPQPPLVRPVLPLARPTRTRLTRTLFRQRTVRHVSAEHAPPSHLVAARRDDDLRDRLRCRGRHTDRHSPWWIDAVDRRWVGDRTCDSELLARVDSHLGFLGAPCMASRNELRLIRGESERMAPLACSAGIGAWPWPDDGPGKADRKTP